MSSEKKIKIDDRMETSRRKFLKTASSIAVYTPPAMLVMSQPSYASVRTSGGNRNFQNVSLQRGEISCTRAAGPWTKNIVARFCRLF